MDQTETVTAFHAAARWTGVIDTDRQAWLDARRTMVTASDVAAILGEDSRRSPYHVYVDKLVPSVATEPTLEDLWLWGSVLEQPILTTVARLNGWEYRRGGALLQSRAHPVLGCTLDAEIDRRDGLGWLPLEGKTSQITSEWDATDQDLPMRVLLQVQAQGTVTQAPELPVFALLVGCRPCMITLQPDRDLQTIIVEAAEAFMERVAKLDPPPVGPNDHVAIARLYPQDDGSVRQLPAEVLEWTREIRALAEQQKTIESRAKTLRNSIRLMLENATYGEMPEDVDGSRYWKSGTVRREPYTVAGTEYRDLRLVKKVGKK
jgi:predicted phage-related endonuclease